MKQFLQNISGRIRPVLCLALVLLVIVLYMSLSALDQSGIYTSLQEAVMLDLPEDRMKALFQAVDKLTQKQILEKVILATLVIFGSVCTLLAQPNPPEQETAADIIKAVKYEASERETALEGQVKDLSGKLDKLKQALGE